MELEKSKLEKRGPRIQSKIERTRLRACFFKWIKWIRNNYFIVF